MSKWKCEICGNKFENFHAQGFDNKIYCPLCYFKKKNQKYKKAIDEALEYIENWLIINEEPKEIEKLEPVRGSDLTDLTSKDVVLKNTALIELCKTLNNMNNKINELIDEVNKLKEK